MLQQRNNVLQTVVVERRYPTGNRLRRLHLVALRYETKQASSNNLLLSSSSCQLDSQVISAELVAICSINGPNKANIFDLGLLLRCILFDFFGCLSRSRSRRMTKQSMLRIHEFKKLTSHVETQQTRRAVPQDL